MHTFSSDCAPREVGESSGEEMAVFVQECGQGPSTRRKEDTPEHKKNIEIEKGFIVIAQSNQTCSSRFLIQHVRTFMVIMTGN